MGARCRVVGLRYVPAAELVPNPKNWRKHPAGQREALRAILADVGIAGAVMARELPDGRLMLVDGHLRQEEAGAEPLPVLVVDLSEEEADKVLLTHDPLAAMASADAERLEALLQQVQTGSEALAGMLAGLAEEAGVLTAEEVDPPTLSSSDREPFQDMTFRLHDSQVEAVRSAIDKAKAAGGFDGSPNQNGNGNALARIAEAYLGAG